MATPLEPRKNELQSTYMVQDRQNQEELMRLVIQDQMLTTGMGGVLPEQDNPTNFHSVLDVACGTGGWAIEAAKLYPTMSLVGVDISKSMIEYARERAEVEQVAERVKFRVMDTLRLLEFPNEFFDLVNMRLGSSFLRTWDWSKLLAEFQRVTKRKGMIRITECDAVESNSESLSHLVHVFMQTLYNAGNFFRLENNGLTSELVPLLTQHGLKNVQIRVHPLTYHTNTSEGDYFTQDMKYIFRTVRPFMQKWTQIPENYDELYQQALADMQQADFEGSWRFITAWGSVTKTNRGR